MDELFNDNTKETTKKEATKFITNIRCSDPKLKSEFEAKFRSKFKSMSDAINVFARKSVKLDFLVGYFFFSGFKELYKDIGDKPLRILVGLEAEREVRKLVEKYSISEKRSPSEDDDKTREQFEEAQINALNTNEADGPEEEEAVKFFAEKLKNGTLEVCKTKEPNHAKIYLFSFPESDEDYGRVLIGSSNLSYKGLLGQNEINILLKDDHDFNDASMIFEALWSNSIPLADKNTDIDKILKQTWVKADPTPYLMYIRALYEYFSVNTGEFKTPRQCSLDESILDVQYQLDAVQEGIYKIKKHFGCIIADVVGLGKTIVAATIAANLKLTTIVICPPHMKEQWEYETDRFRVPATIFGSGLESIEEAVKRFSNRRGELLVIVDEAHRYRNESTETYALLHRLCFGNKVVLLSATPFNNRPGDIFSLIKLFQIPSHSTIQTVNNLGDKMTELEGRYNELQSKNRNKKKEQQDISDKKAKLANELRDVLEPVMIRRTRTDLEKIEDYQKDLKTQHIKFSELADPISLEYELKPEDLTNLYVLTLEQIKPSDDVAEQEEAEQEEELKKFKATRYRPLTYLKNDPEIIEKYGKLFSIENFQPGQKNMATFMQRLLVRRFESCFESFRISLDNLLTSCRTVKKWYDKEKVVPICKKGRRLPEILDDDDTIDIYEEVEKKLRDKTPQDPDIIFVKKDELDEKKFESDLNGDIEVLEDLMKKWGKMTKGFTVDPKMDLIARELKDHLDKDPDRKIIIFTEFTDTADHLEKELKKRGLKKTFKYTGESRGAAREIVRRNFDASLPENNRDDDFNILVATDAISEGYNLHRAGAIYNYDIPYNPTRIIQRVGRIDRMNKKVFDHLFIYNFFPTPIGEEYSRTEEIAKFKMSVFRAILGADAKLLSPEEDNPEGYLNRKIVEERNESRGEDSWKSEFLNDFNRIKAEEKDLFKKAKKIPPRTRISRPNAPAETPQGVYVFAKKGDDCRFAFAPRDGSKPEALSPEAVLKVFKASKDEKYSPVSDNFYTLYDLARGNLGHTEATAKVPKQLLAIMRDAIETLERQQQTETLEFRYLKKLEDVVGDGGLYIKSYLNLIKEDSLGSIEKIASFRKECITEELLDSIKDRIEKMVSAPESIVLSEEF